MFLRRRVPETGPLKAAVVGAGVFGHHHATKYKTLGQSGKGVALFAVADPNAEMRAKAKAHHGCVAVADWREFLGKVDLVSVCSPAITHAEIVRDFLKAGTHVLVEKPIATTQEEAAELVALSRETGRILSSAIRSVLFLPAPAFWTSPKRHGRSPAGGRDPGPAAATTSRWFWT